MKRHEEELLNRAIEAVRTDEPDSEAIHASAARISDRLGVAMKHEAQVIQIHNCEDVRQLLNAYREGTLSEARSLLVKAHLSDCGACLRYFREGSKAAVVDWSIPSVLNTTVVHRRPLGWALAVSLALLALTAFLYTAYWEVPAGVRAEVQSIDGSAYLISNAGDRKLSPGATLGEGDRLRTNGGSRAVLRLSDGSTVEVNERSALEVGARGRDMTVALDGGDVIVQAARRTSGHLYVKTPDCRVAVTGTVFTVDSGLKGSRVAVLQGSVQVTHSGIHSMLRPGDQIATSDNLAPEPLEQQIAWSPDREKYVGHPGPVGPGRASHRADSFSRAALHQRSAAARACRYTALHQHSQSRRFSHRGQSNLPRPVDQSPELQEWWAQGHNNSAELDAMVTRIHDVSTYLGDEAVIVGVKQASHPGFAVLADVEKSGLDDLLKQQAADAGAADKFIVLDEQSLAAAARACQQRPRGLCAGPSA